MPTSTSERALKLSTDNPQAEILLVDGSFRVLKRGPSPLEHSGPPGLYAMKVKVGDQESEKILVVEPDAAPFQDSLAAPNFESPIPLARTSTTHEYHQLAASRLLSQGAATVSLGMGSAVMVCVRDPSKTNFAAAEVTASEADRARYAASFDGFRILDRQGAVIVDLDKQAERNMADGYIAITAELPPGPYVLAYRSGTSWVCSPLPTAAGWTLQVYINVVSSGEGRFSLVPDLPGMAVVLGQLGSGFEPLRTELLAGETVRQGLLEGRNYVDTPSMRAMLTGKFDDPMLGLYGVHLMMVEPTPDWPHIAEVLWNLEGLLGPQHPDVVALWVAYEHANSTQPPTHPQDLATRIAAVEGPPLLARSWDLLVAATNREPALLMSAANLFQVARDLVPNGVFVAWRQRTLEAMRMPMAMAEPPSSAVVEGLPGEIALPSLSKVVITSGPAPKSPGLRGVAGVVVAVAGPLIAASTKIVQQIRRLRLKPEEINIPAQIAEIDSNDKAAAALVAFARRYDWAKLLPELRKNNEWAQHLSGLQRDLVFLLRDASSDPLALQGLDARFVEQLLQTHRVPLPTLVDALSDMELGGWASAALRDLVAKARRRGSAAARSHRRRGDDPRRSS